jgi:hypothetical protein
MSLYFWENNPYFLKALENWSERFIEEINLLLLSEIDPRLLERPASSVVAPVLPASPSKSSIKYLWHRLKTYSDWKKTW